MLPRKNRLPLRTELKRLKRDGKIIQDKYFSLLLNQPSITTNIQLNQPSRFAFVVSKKIDKRATRRNRIKRLISEAIRQLLPETKTGTEGIFYVKKAIIDKNLEEIKNEVKNSLS